MVMDCIQVYWNHLLFFGGRSCSTIVQCSKPQNTPKDKINFISQFRFENGVLWRIVGMKRDEVTGEWKKLHNEELHDLYSLPSIIRIIKPRRMIWVGHVARMEAKRNTHRLVVGKPEGRKPLGRPRRRWVSGWGILGWIL
jgi:hypothetical protein